MLLTDKHNPKDFIENPSEVYEARMTYAGANGLNRFASLFEILKNGEVIYQSPPRFTDNSNMHRVSLIMATEILYKGFYTAH